MNKFFIVCTQSRNMYSNEKRGYRRTRKNSFGSGTMEDSSIALSWMFRVAWINQWFLMIMSTIWLNFVIFSSPMRRHRFFSAALFLVFLNSFSNILEIVLNFTFFLFLVTQALLHLNSIMNEITKWSFLSRSNYTRLFRFVFSSSFTIWHRRKATTSN